MFCQRLELPYTYPLPQGDIYLSQLLYVYFAHPVWLNSAAGRVPVRLRPAIVKLYIPGFPFPGILKVWPMNAHASADFIVTPDSPCSLRPAKAGKPVTQDAGKAPDKPLTESSSRVARFVRLAHEGGSTNGPAERSVMLRRVSNCREVMLAQVSGKPPVAKVALLTEMFLRYRNELQAVGRDSKEPSALPDRRMLVRGGQDAHRVPGTPAFNVTPSRPAIERRWKRQG